MKKFIREHLQKIFAGHGMFALALLALVVTTFTLRGPDVVALLGAVASSLNGPSAVLYFVPYATNSLQVGDTAQIDVTINARVPINAIGATIKFPEDSLDVVGINKEKSFLDLWTEETVIREHAGEVHFSGGTLRKGGLVGVGTAITLTVRAKKKGDAELRFVESQIFAHNGKGELIDTSEERSFTYVIADAPSAQHITIDATASERIPPTADLDGNGNVSLVDMSILTIHLLGPYHGRFDLNNDGLLNLADLSTLFAQMQKLRQ